MQDPHRSQSCDSPTGNASLSARAEPAGLRPSAACRRGLPFTDLPN
jgi:hypothetical protein